MELIRRQKVIPRDPRTAPQIDRRTAFQRARDFWGTFTDEQFLAWNTLASTRQTHPVLGQSSDLSGYELAVQINVHLATVGLPMLPTPSPVPVFPANPVLGLDITGAGGRRLAQASALGPAGPVHRRPRRQAPRPRRLLC